MKSRTYRLDLTEDELVAVFSECNCCSDQEAHEFATGKAYRKLRQIGYFRRAERRRAEQEAARNALHERLAARSREILETPGSVDEVNERIRKERDAAAA